VRLEARLRAGAVAASLWLVACEAAPVSPSPSKPQATDPAGPREAAPEAPKPVAESAAPAAPNTERHFGAALALNDAIPVAQVLGDPQAHLGKVVQCSGVIARVCERAGCWLELRPEGSEVEGLRVPMARHAFFIPQDAVGRPALVEGELTARALGAGERAHLESEGLRAVGPLSLSATGVVIR